ncbi:MAG: homocysteine biosynthesis protein [Limnochordia bacterium]|nr:homocysteine biosynthesis protein [Limnochordia bacterium]MDD2630077.1 homocysteine biosynthesis protein [Limnochordia bacterium]MDD4518369.1 homocysteine biosynthesis protein [Limnochordia bacterium]
MAVKKTYAQINEKIKEGRAVVVTAEEIIPMAQELGYEEVVKRVDVVTTATFGPMCSSGAFLNFGHSDPPIKMAKVWLNDVPAYAGLAAVDAYIGATELSETKGMAYGGAHVIEDLIAGEPVILRATAPGTDCYPKTRIETVVTLDDLNQAYLFNPRNVYQNYAAAVNTSDHVLYTYMGTLLPNLANVTYSTSGELSPLLNDPCYRAIGIGTRIFLGGAQGYVAWQGTQHSPSQNRGANQVPTSSAGTLAVIGDLKQMERRYLRAAVMHEYGVTMFVGVGIPIPILDEEMARYVSVRNEEIYTTIVDYSVPQRSRPTLGQVSYSQLRSGSIQLNGKRIRTASLSSLVVARDIAEELKKWIQQGQFLLQEPIESLPQEGRTKPLEVRPVKTDKVS